MSAPAIIKPDMPKPPGWLSEDAQAKWYVVYPTLDHGRVRGGALDTLALYCEAYAAWRTSAEALQTQSIVLKDGKGAIVANPHVAARDAAMKQMQQLAEKLGISPDTLLPKVTRWEDIAAVIGRGDDVYDDDESAGGAGA